MLTMYLIASVVIAFWLAIMMGGWPFTTLIKNPMAAGLTILVACYVINSILFRIFFNYDFMKGAPVYVAAQDPGGMFNAWNAVVFYVTAIGVLFLLLCFDLWPLTTSPSLMKQPVLGIVWTILALVIGYAAFYIGVDVMKMDVVVFQDTVPIPFIFGTIIVLNMLQGSLFAKFTQPLKGVLNTLAAAIIGSVLALMYKQLAGTLTGKARCGTAFLSVGNLAGFGAAGRHVPVPGGLRGLLHHVAAAARQGRASHGNRRRALIYWLVCVSELSRLAIVDHGFGVCSSAAGASTRSSAILRESGTVAGAHREIHRAA